jgi:hypothetical protein
VAIRSRPFSTTSTVACDRPGARLFRWHATTLLQQVTFGGIGNVAGVLVSGNELRRMVAIPGTAGYNVRKIQSFQYPLESGLVILCSDGVSTSWTLDRYPNFVAAHPTLIAAVLYRDFSRRRDDATVLVGKWVAPAKSVAGVTITIETEGRSVFRPIEVERQFDSAATFERSLSSRV